MFVISLSYFLLMKLQWLIVDLVIIFVKPLDFKMIILEGSHVIVVKDII